MMKKLLSTFVCLCVIFIAQAQETPGNPTKFHRNKQTDILLQSKNFNAGFWMNTEKWGFDKSEVNPYIEYQLRWKDSSLYGMIITEKNVIPLESFREIAIENLQKKHKNAKIVEEEYRKVNGLKVLFLRMDVEIKKVMMSMYGYYFSNENGSVQFVAFASKKVVDEYRKECDELLNGLVETPRTFEGCITYEVSYEDNNKDDEMTTEQLYNIIGNEDKFYIKGGDYRLLHNGKIMESQLYKAIDNRCYTKFRPDSTTWYWSDFGKSPEEYVPIRHKVQKNKETILGIPCDLLIIEGEKTTSHYYFNSNYYPANPDLYRQHTHTHWYYMLAKTKSLPLKSIVIEQSGTSIRTAIKVEEMKLENRFFALPNQESTAPFPQK